MEGEGHSELNRLAKDLLGRVTGLSGVYVSDSYGVPLVQATREGGSAPGDDLARSLAATFAVAADHINKVQLGKSESVVSFYSDFVVVQINHLPLVVTFILEETEEANVGLLLALGNDLKKVLEPLRRSIVQLDSESGAQRD